MENSSILFALLFLVFLCALQAVYVGGIPPPGTTTERTVNIHQNDVDDIGEAAGGTENQEDIKESAPEARPDSSSPHNKSTGSEADPDPAGLSSVRPPRQFRRQTSAEGQPVTTCTTTQNTQLCSSGEGLPPANTTGDTRGVDDTGGASGGTVLVEDLSNGDPVQMDPEDLPEASGGSEDDLKEQATGYSSASSPPDGAYGGAEADPATQFDRDDLQLAKRGQFQQQTSPEVSSSDSDTQAAGNRLNIFVRDDSQLESSAEENAEQDHSPAASLSVHMRPGYELLVYTESDYINLARERRWRAAARSCALEHLPWNIQPEPDVPRVVDLSQARRDRCAQAAQNGRQWNIQPESDVPAAAGLSQAVSSLEQLRLLRDVTAVFFQFWRILLTHPVHTSQERTPPSYTVRQQLALALFMALVLLYRLLE